MTEVRHNDHAWPVLGVTVQRKALIANLAAAAAVLASGLRRVRPRGVRGRPAKRRIRVIARR